MQSRGYKANFSPLVYNLYCQSSDIGIHTSGTDKFIITEDGKFIMSENNYFLKTES